jgi:hypothetical protein
MKKTNKNKKPTVYQLLTKKCIMNRARKIRRAMIVSYILLGSIIVSAGVIGYFSQLSIEASELTPISVPRKEKPAPQPVVKAQPAIKIYTPEEAKQKSIEILRSRNWTEHAIDNFLCLMKYENGGFKQFPKPNVNSNGTTDSGYMQWNSDAAPIKISETCKHDVECSTTEFAKYVEDNKVGWDRWYGFKYNCK